MTYLQFILSTVILGITSFVSSPQTEITPNVRETLSEMLGEQLSENEIVIVNLWRTSCKPCIEEIPSLNKLVEDYNGEKVRFIALSDEHPDKLKTFNFNNFQKRRHELIFKFDQVFGNHAVNKYVRSMEEKNGGVPIHLLIKADGTLGRVLRGASTSYDKIMRDFIEKELAGK